MQKLRNCWCQVVVQRVRVKGRVAYSEGRKLAAGFVAVATELHQLLDDPSLLHFMVEDIRMSHHVAHSAACFGSNCRIGAGKKLPQSRANVHAEQERVVICRQACQLRQDDQHISHNDTTLFREHQLHRQKLSPLHHLHAFIHHELMSERLVLKHQHRQKVKPGAKAWPPSLATSSHTLLHGQRCKQAQNRGYRLVAVKLCMDFLHLAALWLKKLQNLQDQPQRSLEGGCQIDRHSGYL
mmetsp:Transcript_48814/g.106342  ORF Transcript_48814/g.106342 Transcript_48814/m.106342 type:complete len:239 (+) Transcript_48814:388-1104(+)